MLLGINKLPGFVYLIYPLPLILLIILFSRIAYLCSLEFMVLYLNGSHPTLQIVYSVSSVYMISLNLTEVVMAYHKTQYLDPTAALGTG